MQSKVEKQPNSRVKIIVTADAKDLTHPAEHAVKYLTGQVSVKGFRPGKAPLPVMIAQVGKARILSELVDHALPEFVYQVAVKENLTVIETPKYTLNKLCELNDDGTPQAGTTLEFTAEMDVAPEVKVGDYTKLKVKRNKAEVVTDAAVDEFIADLAKQQAPWEAVKRPARQGDRVTISFVGKRNGLPEKRLQSDDYPVIIGSNVMIPGFEDALVGHAPGDAPTLKITFPADYHAPDLANQPVVFEVKIKDVAERKLPPIDNAFAKQFGHKTLDELKRAIKSEREVYAAHAASEKTKSRVLDALETIVTVDPPESLIEKEIDHQIEAIRQQIDRQGLNFDQYLEHLKKTEEQLRDEIRPNALKAVVIGLGLGEVAKKEGIDGRDAGRKAIERLVEIAAKG